MPPTTLFGNLRLVITDPRLVVSIVALVVLLLVSAALATYDAVVVLNMTQSKYPEFIADCLVLLVELRCMQMVADYLEKMVRTMCFIPRAEKIVRQRMWSLVRDADRGFLMDKEDDRSFNLTETMNNGIYPQVRIISNILQYTKPVIYTISQLYVVFNIAGTFYGVSTVCALLVLMGAGLVMVNLDYTASKEINKNTKADSNMAMSQAKSFVVNLINGRADQVIESMVSLLKNRGDQHRWRRCKRTTFDLGLEIFNIIIPIGLVYSALGKVAITSYIPLFYSIVRACDYAWWLFFSLDGVFQTCAEWGPMEEFLTEYVPGKVQTAILDADQFHPSWARHQRVRITGKDGKSESGAGKSSLMKKWIRGLSVRFAAGQWMYMKQEVCLEYSKDTIHEVMSQYYPDGLMADVDQLCELARLLKVDNLINIRTLADKFVSPSVGEKQSIKVIQFIMPLVDARTSAYKSVKVVLLDEASSGMDDGKVGALYGILERIMARGVKVIEIDHCTSVKPKGPMTLVPVFKYIERINGKDSDGDDKDKGSDDDDDDDDEDDIPTGFWARLMLAYRPPTPKKRKTRLHVWTSFDPVPQVALEAMARKGKKDE
jgi:hypothetical protein